MNSIGLYNSLASTNTALAKNNDQVAHLNKVEQVNDVSKEKSSDNSAGERLILSSHSQKLQAISEQFFANSGFSQSDTKELINQSHEYGLISDDDLASLTHHPLFQNVTDDESQQDNLIDYLQGFKASIDVDDTQESQLLSKGVSGAIAVLSDVEGQKLLPTFKHNIMQAISQLGNFSQSESYDVLERQDQESIQSSVAALSVIDKISPQRLSNPYVNRYLDFAQ